MANLKVNAEFDTAMEQLTPKTRAHADRFNERYEQLLGNDAFLKGKIEDANTNIERAMAVAQGKSAGYVFNTYSELIAYIAVPANVEKFRLGDQFLIKATDVPDYWWDNTVTTAQTDSAGNVISGKNTSGKIIGALVELEARKIDLSKYDANDAALFNNMSDQYSSARAYDVGDICIHNNDLYKCVTAVEAAETFNASKWNKTSLAALHAEQEKKISENTQSLTTENGTKFRFGQNSDGEYGYIINKDGADTVIPFKKETTLELINEGNGGFRTLRDQYIIKNENIEPGEYYVIISIANNYQLESVSINCTNGEGQEVLLKNTPINNAALISNFYVARLSINETSTFSIIENTMSYYSDSRSAFFIYMIYKIN